MKRRKLLTIVSVACLTLVLLVPLALGACAPAPPPEAEWPSMFALGTLPPAAKAARMTTGVAKIIDKYSPDYVTVKVSNQDSPLRVFESMNEGREFDMTVLLTMNTWDAYFGVFYPERLTNLRILCSVQMFDSEAGCRGDSGINHPRDIKGKRFARVEGHPSGMLCQDAILESGGLTWDDVTVVSVANPVEGVLALLDDRADICGVLGTGMGIFDQAVEKVDAYILKTPWGDPGVAELYAVIPSIQPTLLPKDIWLGVPEDTWTTGFPGIAIASTHMSDELAYEITKMLYDYLDEYAALDPWFAAMVELQGGRDGFMQHSTMGTPYHPGAIRFMKEIGLWTDTHEQAQELLLKDPPELLPVPFEISH